MPKIEIVDSATGEVDHTIETEYEVGSNAYDKLLDGLYRRVDSDRYYVREEDQ